MSVSVYGLYFYSQDDFSFLNALTKIVVVVGGIALVISIGIAYLLARNISKPILKAVEVTDHIANGQYDIRSLEDTNITELDRLSSSIHKMADSIMKQELLRKQLTSDVAHELRTPLIAVSTHLEAMIEGIWEATPKHLESCYEEVNRIIFIVKDLEKLEQLEKERYTLPIKEKGLTATLAGKNIMIAADEERITQVMVNLLSNAIKYTKEGDEIGIHIEESEQEVQVTIADTEIGMKEEELPFIFERFYRADKSKNRQTGGAGIGLAIVKSIVQAHKGTITVKSEQGKGTTFELRLPRGQQEKNI